MPRFIQALEQEDSEYTKHALWLLLLTGLRVRELLKAKWTDIDWDAGTLFVGLTKNGEPLLAPEPLPPAPAGLPELLRIRARATSNSEAVVHSVPQHHSPADHLNRGALGRE